MPTQTKGYLTVGILIICLIITGIWYVATYTQTLAEKGNKEEIYTLPEIHKGPYIVIYLNKMNIELHIGTSTITTIPIVSIGKKGSYYETIGGNYINDYKERLHFSSIGHVYMPYSVHIFGNFFTHGIPYYQDGTKVSSAFSGGCIRLSDADAKTLYDFVTKDTTIIITSDDEYDFSPTQITTNTIESMEITRLMVAIISLEVLTQDDEIVNTDGISITTRRKLISQLIKDKNDDVSVLYARALGETTFVMYMNKKAQSLGLTNTVFTNVKNPVKTTGEDYLRFMKYIDTYKSYLRTDMR